MFAGVAGGEKPGANPEATAHSLSHEGQPLASTEELNDLLCLWDVAEGITLDDPAEVARSAYLRGVFWADVEQGSRARESAIHDLVEGLLTWLEQRPRRTVAELMALARVDPWGDASDLLDEAINRENLRVTWVPRLQAALHGDSTAPGSLDDHGGPS